MKLQEKLIHYQHCLSGLARARLSDMPLDESLIHICREASIAIGSLVTSVWSYNSNRKAFQQLAYFSPEKLAENKTVLDGDDALLLSDRLVQGFPVRKTGAHQNAFGVIPGCIQINPVLTSVLNVPLLKNGTLEIVICCEAPREHRNWDEYDVCFCESILTLLLLVIEMDKSRKAQYLSENYARQTLEYSNQLVEMNRDMRKIMDNLEAATKKAEESDRLKVMFLANLSHEIRTPMNGIIGVSELLEMEELPHSKRLEFTKIIRDRVRDLLCIINSVLDLSKLENGQAEEILVDGSISEICNRVVNHIMLDKIYMNKSALVVRFINRIPAAHDFVRMDFLKLNQILTNLMTNAVKFTVEGEVTLSCECAGACYLFKVTDTGLGIPFESRQNIFQPFVQLKNSSIRTTGNGLGLAICKGLVEVLGGKIWVESELGKGSTFSFTVPKRGQAPG